jgi:hypothetical protein
MAGLFSKPPPSANDSFEFLQVVTFPFHFVKHPVAVCTDGCQVFHTGSYLSSKPMQRDSVMRLGKTFTKFAVDILKAQTAYLTYIIIVILALRRQVAAAFTL